MPANQPRLGNVVRVRRRLADTGEDESLAENLWGDTKRFLKAAVVDPLVDIKNLAGEFKKPVPEDSRWNFPNVLDPRIGHTLGEMASGIVRSQVDEGREAYEAAQRGNIGEMIKHGTAAAVPVIGPILEDIGTEAYESGDYATGAGRLAELFMPLPKFTKRRAALTKPSAVEFNVPLTRAERMRAQGKTGFTPGVAGFGENIIERTVAGAPAYRRFRKGQHEAVSGRVDDLMAPLKPVGREQVGRNVIADIEKTKARRRKEGNVKYAEVDALSEGVLVDMAPIKRAATRLENKLKRGMFGAADRPGALSDDIAAIAAADEAMLARRGGGKKKKQRDKQKLPTGGTDSAAKQWIANIKKAPGKVTFKEAQLSRRRLQEAGRKLETDKDSMMPSEAIVDFNKLPNAVDQAMETAANKIKKPEVYQKYREAQGFNKETRELVDSDFIREINKMGGKSRTKGVEHVAETVKKSTIKNVETLWGLVSAPVRDQVRAQLMKDTLNKASKGESVTTWDLGTVKPERFKGQLSGVALQRALEDIGADRLKAVYGTKLTKGLKELAEDAKRIGDLGKNPVPGLVAASVNSGLIFGWLVSPMSTGVTASGLALASKVLVSQPKAVPAYKKFISALTRRDSRAALVLASQLQDMFDKEQEASMPGTPRRVRVPGSIRMPRTPAPEASPPPPE